MGRKLIIIIILLASFLRLWKLDQVPVSLFGDELDVGYHAYSVLKTGRDYMGQFLPSYMHSLAEWRAPLFLYSAIPTVALFGLNEWGVRLPAAFFGILSVWLLYLLTKRLTGNAGTSHGGVKLATIASFLLAITPWHIHYSRAAFEVTLLVVLLLAGTLLFLDATRKKLFLSAVFFALSPYTYSTAAVFTPLYVLFLLFLSKNTIPRKNLSLFVITGAIVILPFIQATFFGPAAGRFSLLSVFSNDQIIDTINRGRTETGLPNERIFHNKLIGWGEVIASNYIRSFSPEFLFVNGDPNLRHSVPGLGVLYWAMLPLLIVGVYQLLKARSHTKRLVLGWLLLAPIPASLTVDGANHATRLFLLVIPLVMISAFGFEALLNSKHRLGKIVLIGSVVFLVLNFLGYQHRYFGHYNLQTWRGWHFGYKEAMAFMRQNENEYELVVFNNTYEPGLIRFLFWWEYPPEKFLNQFSGDKPEENVLPGFDGFSLGERYYFGKAKAETGGVAGFVTPQVLYLVSQRDEVAGDWDWEKSPPVGIRVLQTVRNPQGEPIFYVVTGN